MFNDEYGLTQAVLNGRKKPNEENFKRTDADTP